MVWKIAKKDFLLNLMTFKFAVGTILCVVLIAIFMPVLVSDYQQRLIEYNKNVAYNEAELRKVRVYKNITPTIYRPPTVLSIFGEGLEKTLGNSAEVVLENVPGITAASTELNPYLSIFPTLDISLIFRVVMSVLALLVACDAISGEREEGTLKLIVSGTVARHRVLLGKLLAGLMTLAVPTTVVFIVGLLIVQLFPMVDLTSSDWTRVVLMYIGSLLFVVAMYSFGLLFSCLTKRSSISLMFVLLFWVVFLVVIPKVSLHLASRFHILESQEKMDNQIQLLWEEYEAEEHKHFRSGSCSGVRGAFRRWYPCVCDTRWLQSNSRYYSLREPVKIKYANKAGEIRREYLSSLFEQEYLARNLSYACPVGLYKKVISSLAGTDLRSFESFVGQAQAYRRSVVDYIRSNTDDFASSSYFTLCKEGDWEEYKEMGHKKWVREKVEAAPTIDLEGLPKFIYKPESAIQCVSDVIPEIGLLVFSNILFLSLSLVCFLRYDVR